MINSNASGKPGLVQSATSPLRSSPREGGMKVSGKQVALRLLRHGRIQGFSWKISCGFVFYW